MEEQFSQLVEHKFTYISKGKRKIGKNKYTLLRKTYDVLSSGGFFFNYNYKIFIDTTRFVSLMQHIQKNLQLKDIRLHNVIIGGHKLKYIPVYERGGKCIQSFF